MAIQNTLRTGTLFILLGFLSFFPAVLTAQNCDTVTNVMVTDTATIYPLDTGGYISGHNKYGDLSKADKFTSANTAHVTDALLFFGVAKYANQNSVITVNVWDDDGTAGAPGTVLASETVTIKSIVETFDSTSNIYKALVQFTPQPLVTGNYYVGISFTYAAGDTVALLTTTNLSRPGTAWEEFANHSWFPYADTAASWGLNVAHFISLIACDAPSGTAEITAPGKIAVTSAPNPFTNSTTIDISGVSNKYDFNLYDLAGKAVRQLNSIPAGQFILPRQDLSPGIYLYTISAENGAMVKGKLMVE